MSKLLADIRAYMNHRLADAGFEHVAELAEYLHRLYPVDMAKVTPRRWFEEVRGKAGYEDQELVLLAILESKLRTYESLVSNSSRVSAEIVDTILQLGPRVIAYEDFLKSEGSRWKAFFDPFEGLELATRREETRSAMQSKLSDEIVLQVDKLKSADPSRKLIDDIFAQVGKEFPNNAGKPRSKETIRRIYSSAKKANSPS